MICWGVGVGENEEDDLLVRVEVRVPCRGALVMCFDVWVGRLLGRQGICASSPCCYGELRRASPLAALLWSLLTPLSPLKGLPLVYSPWTVQRVFWRVWTLLLSSWEVWLCPGLATLDTWERGW